MTATNKMTKATRETTKLNFITDQGSTRAMVRCACRADRFACAFCAAARAAAGPSPAAALSGAALSGAVVPRAGAEPEVDAALRAAGPLPVKPDRRNVRAGDDGEFGGGSGISHANAAGETDGGSAGAGRLPAAVRPAGAAPDGEAARDGAVPARALAGRSSPGGTAADSAG